MNCSQRNLKTILMRHILDGEKILAVACIEWAKKHYKIDPEVDLKRLRDSMGDLFTLIPFATMELNKLIDFKNEGLLTDEDIRKAIADRKKTSFPIII